MLCQHVRYAEFSLSEPHLGSMLLQAGSLSGKSSFASSLRGDFIGSVEQ